MSKRVRLSAEDRKKQICEAGKKLFLEKGFRATTMEDIMRASGLSKGGLYHHYHSTTEILYDLMMLGNEKRFELSEDFMKNHIEISREEMILEITLSKILDQNEYKSLYAILLMEAKKDERLQELLIKLNEDSQQEFLQFIKKNQLEELACLVSEEFMAFVNAMIVATEVLDVREVFLQHKEFFKMILENYQKMKRNEVGEEQSVEKE